MAKGKGEKKMEKNTRNLKNSGTESMKDDLDDKDATIKALKKEIDIFKKKIADQDETINDLVQERDEVCHEMFEVRLILADAWNIKRDSKAEKIWEVLRRTREIKQTQVEKKPYNEAVKSNEYQEDSTNVSRKMLNTTGNDSGIELLDAVTREIKDHVEILVNEKLNDFGIKPNLEKFCTVSANDMKEKISGGISRMNTNLENKSMNTNLETMHNLNIIIHGISKRETTDDVFIKELFGIMQVDTGRQ